MSGQRRHTLGAVFALNHRQVLTDGVPPVRPIAEQVHRQGGLLELDKHNWPWSMMLVPVMEVDLYELTNNHIWRAEFFFRGYGEAAAAYMGVERDERGWTERGWIEFGLQNYYTLLNCGYSLRPTAGTASGVHPVPLGFGRVYVHVGDGFSYDAWMKGLDEGRSFVTTGPMLNVTVDGQMAGEVFDRDGATRIQGWAKSANPLTSLEIVVNGERATLEVENRRLDDGSYENRIDTTRRIQGSSWLAVRCFEEAAGGRPRFAHTGPVHYRVADRPLYPRREEVEYLVQRVRDQLQRNNDVLNEDALQEYRQALAAYELKLEHAR